ncbi:hypothetical protein JCM10914A_32310 [Paenibacillus sp. JCM 10914]|uniref:hypothetical protein n=1 Tax=Paenibacillus sp. JCM 10914 TaxID=1236974 RepID=UPI0003CC6C89|nr:hypothetical protein [Paenibacillus sp. JCM 10914]GAE07784.1 hypothetical protein JCM10914_4029 [Paenibacillus sp. JCM 10914]
MNNRPDKENKQMEHEHGLVIERDIDAESGLFREDSYPDSEAIPDSIRHEKPDGSDSSNRGNQPSSAE